MTNASIRRKYACCSRGKSSLLLSSEAEGRDFTREHLELEGSAIEEAEGLLFNACAEVWGKIVTIGLHPSTT